MPKFNSCLLPDTGHSCSLTPLPQSTGCFRILGTILPIVQGVSECLEQLKNTVGPIKQWNRRTASKQSDVYLLFLIKENSSSWKNQLFQGKGQL